MCALIERENCDGWPHSAKVPVIFPVSREFGAETGSQLTASSASQSGLHRYLRVGCRNPLGSAPFAGYGSVSASRIGLGKCHFGVLSPRPLFGVSFSDDGCPVSFKYDASTRAFRMPMSAAGRRCREDK